MKKKAVYKIVYLKLIVHNSLACKSSFLNLFTISLLKPTEFIQFTSPVFTAPYNEAVPRDRLLSNYELIHGKVHDENCPLKLLYKVDGKETMLAWVGWIYYVLGVIK